VIFIDTGAFIARYIARDEHHEDAVSFWLALEKAKDRLFTSNFVLDETFTLLGRKAGYKFAAERAKIILSSSVITVLRPENKDEIAAVKLFEKYADNEVSYTDCISFILMKEQRITRVFSFDRHYKTAGFVLLP
jgi:predicted nucleic acid-binding protein